ncbi:MAG: hypothetical protein RIR12_2621 [Bacteroidota bacterium]|jgi:hypothetical protein
MRNFIIFLIAILITALVTAQNNGTFKFYNTPPDKGAAVSKTSFKSNEFIYARMELGKTLKEYFKIEDPDVATNPHVLVFRVKSDFTAKDGQSYLGSYYGSHYLYVKPEDLSKTYLDLDILPDPALASSVFCLVSTFKGGKYGSPVYGLDLTSKKNNSTLHYTILLVGGTTNGNDYDKPGLPKATFTFDIVVNHADQTVIDQNEKLCDKKVAEEGMNLTALPPIFSKPSKPTDPKLQPAKLAAILKRDYPHRQVLKMALRSDGGNTWLISKNDFGIPRYRYYNGILHIAYKQDGVCYVGTVELIENYKGGGTYWYLVADYSSEYDRKINCAAVK